MPLEMQIFIPWLITVLTETVVSLIWGFRRLRELGIILLINTVTNPLLNVLAILMNLYFPYSATRICILCLEVIIFLAEALLFKAFLERCRHPWLLSLTCNAASYAAGLLILPHLIR